MQSATHCAYQICRDLDPITSIRCEWPSAFGGRGQPRLLAPGRGLECGGTVEELNSSERPDPTFGPRCGQQQPHLAVEVVEADSAQPVLLGARGRGGRRSRRRPGGRGRRRFARAGRGLV